MFGIGKVIVTSSGQRQCKNVKRRGDSGWVGGVGEGGSLGELGRGGVRESVAWRRRGLLLESA